MRGKTQWRKSVVLALWKLAWRQYFWLSLRNLMGYTLGKKYTLSFRCLHSLCVQSTRLERIDYGGFISFLICAYCSFWTVRIPDCNNTFNLFSQMCTYFFIFAFTFLMKKQKQTANTFRIVWLYSLAIDIVLNAFILNFRRVLPITWKSFINSCLETYRHEESFYSGVATCLILFLPFVVGIAKTKLTNCLTHETATSLRIRSEVMSK